MSTNSNQAMVPYPTDPRHTGNTLLSGDGDENIEFDINMLVSPVAKGGEKDPRYNGNLAYTRQYNGNPALRQYNGNPALRQYNSNISPGYVNPSSSPYSGIGIPIF